VLAGVAHDVDPLDGLAGAGGDRVGELPGRAGEREDRAVVIGVGARVQQPGTACGEGGSDRIEDRIVAALGDVRDGEERPGPLLAPKRVRRA
jgi:hypothetical protein